VEKIIEEIIRENVKVTTAFSGEIASGLIRLAEKVATAFAHERKLLICGNGGSAADAQHLAAEFVNRYRLERPPLPALALTTDTSVITSIGNDYSFDDIFSKQIKALGMQGDVLLAISTSGKSRNVHAAARAARRLLMHTAAFTGKGGGELAELVDTAIVIESDDTARIQEGHLLACHILCHLVDYLLFQRHAKGA
jgi:D-sedoheptulose 7-phosphate isomerase